MVEEIIKKSNAEKLDYFLKNNIKVHVTKINKGEFLNGWLVKKVKDGVYKIKDDNNSKEIYLFLSEIYDVEQWKPLWNKNEERRDDR